MIELLIFFIFPILPLLIFIGKPLLLESPRNYRKKEIQVIDSDKRKEEILHMIADLKLDLYNEKISEEEYNASLEELATELKQIKANSN